MYKFVHPKKGKKKSNERVLLVMTLICCFINISISIVTGPPCFKIDEKLQSTTLILHLRYDFQPTNGVSAVA